MLTAGHIMAKVVPKFVPWIAGIAFTGLPSHGASRQLLKSGCFTF